ncbi:MAG: hypothetical protein D6790_15045 [Caldilineae bacterium]|nr:MAG: hypothetical protein D6790_15045 [Caldilineae bacterium]
MYICLSDIVTVNKVKPKDRLELLCGIIALRYGQDGRVVLAEGRNRISEKTRQAMQSICKRSSVKWWLILRNMESCEDIATVTDGILTLRDWEWKKYHPFYDTDARISLSGRNTKKWNYHDFVFYAIAHALYDRLKFVDPKARMKMMSYSLIQSEWKKAMGTTLSYSTIRSKKIRAKEFGLQFKPHYIVLNDATCKLMNIPSKHQGKTGRWADYVQQQKGIIVEQGMLPHDAQMYRDGSFTTATEGYQSYSHVYVGNNTYLNASLVQRQRHEHMWQMLEQGKPKQGVLLSYKRIWLNQRPAILFEPLHTLTGLKNGLRRAYGDARAILKREGLTRVPRQIMLDLIKSIAIDSTDLARTIYLDKPNQRSPKAFAKKVISHGLAAACEIDIEANKIVQTVPTKTVVEVLLEYHKTAKPKPKAQGKNHGLTNFIIDENGRINDPRWCAFLRYSYANYGVARIYPTNVQRCTAMADRDLHLTALPQLLWCARETLTTTATNDSYENTSGYPEDTSSYPEDTSGYPEDTSSQLKGVRSCGGQCWAVDGTLNQLLDTFVLLENNIPWRSTWRETDSSGLNGP